MKSKASSGLSGKFRGINHQLATHLCHSEFLPASPPSLHTPTAAVALPAATERANGGEPHLGSYRFGTRWVVQAPRARVWEAIVDTTAWPTWWKGVQSAELLEPHAPNGVGQRIRYVFKSALPYTVAFDIVLRAVSRPNLLLGEASGELEGLGRWDIAEDGGITTLDYTWHVRTTGRAMNLLAPLLRPAFVWNHHVVMRWGAEGLARHLDAPLLGITSTPRLRPVDFAPLAALLAFVALVGRRGRSGTNAAADLSALASSGTDDRH